MKNKADNKKKNFLTHSEIESLLKAANTGLMQHVIIV